MGVNLFGGREAKNQRSNPENLLLRIYLSLRLFLFNYLMINQ